MAVAGRPLTGAHTLFFGTRGGRVLCHTNAAPPTVAVLAGTPPSRDVRRGRIRRSRRRGRHRLDLGRARTTASARSARPNHSAQNMLGATRLRGAAKTLVGARVAGGREWVCECAEWRGRQLPTRRRAGPREQRAEGAAVSDHLREVRRQRERRPLGFLALESEAPNNYVRESGVKWMHGRAKRQCDRTPSPPPGPARRWAGRRPRPRPAAA